MSEIKRTSEKESYNITADWIRDFANKLASSRSVDPEPFKALATKEKFATIEDKMEDIRKRVGFDSIKKVSDQNSDNKIVASSEKCSCGEKCTCKNKERIHSLRTILNYIKDMIEVEPHLSTFEIIMKCKENKDLNYEGTKIKQKNIKDFIENLKKRIPKNQQEIKYIKQDSHLNSSDDSIADYYQHGLPTSS